MSREKYREVDCPKCGAVAGERCKLDKPRRTRAGYIISKRIRAYNASSNRS